MKKIVAAFSKFGSPRLVADITTFTAEASFALACLT